MQVYLVGGAVRDALLNRDVTERDYVVVGASPDEMLRKGYTQVGKDFPVFLHPKTSDEYALARTERKSGKGYTGFICDASTSVTLEEDLMRRDLTVNAMAQDSNGTIIDPYNGRVDLESRILRHVSDAFSEDPLRVFRVARFATRYAYLGFTIAPETEALMTQMAKSGELKSLTAERVWQETKRSLQEKTPEVFFQVLSNVHALEDWFCEIVPTIEDALPTLALSATIKTSSNTDSLIVRFAALTAHLSEDEVKSLCTRLKVQNQVSDVALLVCKFKALLLEEDNTAQALLTLFNGCDAWRRAERFLMILDAVAPYAQYRGNNWNIRQKQILSALSAATQVDVQQIIAQGIKGPAIKPALEEARLTAIIALGVTQ
ncbi:CCA tRNA nucleotidyltransferase [Alteromonas gracilis]|uniref:CCA tRNA nucleotidyltransferase n=1 Tax=Alteromonas gracilis TaxID=1479524 RepID=UPI0030CF7B59